MRRFVATLVLVALTVVGAASICSAQSWDRVGWQALQPSPMWGMIRSIENPTVLDRIYSGQVAQPRGYYGHGYTSGYGTPGMFGGSAFGAFR